MFVPERRCSSLGIGTKACNGSGRWDCRSTDELETYGRWRAMTSLSTRRHTAQNLARFRVNITQSTSGR